MDGKTYRKTERRAHCAHRGQQCGRNQVLYVDPWPGGSTMKYTGGIAGDSRAGVVQHLGMLVLEYDNERD